MCFFCVFDVFFCVDDVCYLILSIAVWKFASGAAPDTTSNSPVLMLMIAFPGVPVTPNTDHPSFICACTSAVYVPASRSASICA